MRLSFNPLGTMYISGNRDPLICFQKPPFPLYHLVDSLDVLRHFLHILAPLDENAFTAVLRLTFLVMLPAPSATMVCFFSMIIPNRSLRCIIVYYLIFSLLQNSIIEYYVVPHKGHLLDYLILCWTRPLCHLKVPPRDLSHSMVN